MTLMELSAELVDWARIERFTYVNGGDALQLYSPGGETRYYIRHARKGEKGFTVTQADRGGSEEFIFTAASLAVVEKYFWVKFGFGIRMSRRMPRLVFPRKSDEIAPGYELRSVQPDMIDLLGAGMEVLATTYDELGGRSLLVELSYVIGYSPEQLRASYLDPNGRPIFPLREALNA